ncbi:MAG: hypothetical protein OXE92_10985 [Bacteroidetes bacterium]|nr:hypothetical protein [Bacteroidota bacterium]MCY4206236.1 hypothetical protein [Bacteroidota bacterium]
MHDPRCRILLLITLLILGCVDVMAQEGFFQRSRHAAAFNFGRINHEYVGAADLIQSYEYQGVAFGLSYIGPQLRAAGLFARTDDSGTFVDLSATAWLLPSFVKVERGNTTIAVPIGFLIAWRRVAPGNDVAPFGANAIMFGGGASLLHSLSQRARFELRAMPLAGITGSEIADAVGFSWAVDSEALVKIADIFSSLGLVIGYTFRYQFWNVNGSTGFSDAVDELYDYAGSVQTISMGIWF